MKTLKIDVWSDIACPWCYVGKRRLEAALADFPHRDAVAVTWHSFELDPSAPAVAPATPSYAERLARKYGRTVAHAQGMIDNMTKVAAVDGLEMRFDRVRAGNTFDAHRLLHLAADKGVQNAMKERLMRAYMTEGEAVGDRDTLARLAADVGLDAEEVRATLATDRYAAEVRADEQNAREIGITGVPFFAVAERYGVSGAQPAEVLREVLDKAWEALADEAPATPAEGAVCGPDGCA
jgi:predicted DsbA family dithiol-disulfide isomerase